MRKFLLLLMACARLLRFPISIRQSVSVKTGTRDNDSLFYSKIKYRLLGPFRGGRSAAVTGSYKNKNTFILVPPAEAFGKQPMPETTGKIFLTRTLVVVWVQ
jgi:hypothetical protein